MCPKIQCVILLYLNNLSNLVLTWVHVSKLESSLHKLILGNVWVIIIILLILVSWFNFFINNKNDIFKNTQEDITNLIQEYF